MAETYDVIVIGAGAMGSATAWQLARRGASVLLLEQFEQGHVRGSSHGGSRIFRLAYQHPDYVRLAQEALAAWRDAEAETGTVLLETTGGVDHGSERALDGIGEALTACAAPFERVSAREAEARYPGMRFATSVILQADAGRCLAGKAVRTFQDGAATFGADVRFSVGRASLEAAEGRAVVSLAGGERFEARVAVVTAGAWLGETLSRAVPRPPTVAVTQEQIVHFAPRDESLEWPSFIDHSRKSEGIYGLRTPGEGIKVARHRAGEPTSGDARSFDLDPEHTAGIVAYVEEWLPGLVPLPVAGATCLYTNTPTQDFVIDREGPIVVGSPCSGHGFKFAPLIGRMLADLAQGIAEPLPRFRMR